MDETSNSKLNSVMFNRLKWNFKLVEFILAWFCLGEIIENLYYRFSGQFHFFCVLLLSLYSSVKSHFHFWFPDQSWADTDSYSKILTYGILTVGLLHRPKFIPQISSLTVFTPAMWTILIFPGSGIHGTKRWSSWTERSGRAPSPYDVIQYRAVTYRLYDIVF